MDDKITFDGGDPDHPYLYSVRGKVKGKPLDGGSGRNWAKAVLAAQEAVASGATNVSIDVAKAT